MGVKDCFPVFSQNTVMKYTPSVEKLIRFLSDDLDEIEQKQVRSWINETVANQHEFERVTDVWASYKKEENLNLDVDDQWRRLSKRIERSRSRAKYLPAPWVYRIAAALFICTAVWYAISEHYSTADGVYHAKNKNELFTLGDGSQVWLNEKSTLTYPLKFTDTNRDVTLEGEAFFDIVRDEKRPFIIHCENTNVKVLGTSFLVNSTSSGDSISVVVKTGKVSFQSAAGSVVLAPGEEAIFSKSANRISKADANFNTLAWHTGEIRFSKTSLKEVLICLQQIFKEEIVATDSISNCRFTGYYVKPELATVINDISLALDLKVSRKKNQIILHGNGCH